MDYSQYLRASCSACASYGELDRFRTHFYGERLNIFCLPKRKKRPSREWERGEVRWETQSKNVNGAIVWGWAFQNPIKSPGTHSCHVFVKRCHLYCYAQTMFIHYVRSSSTQFLAHWIKWSRYVSVAIINSIPSTDSLLLSLLLSISWIGLWCVYVCVWPLIVSIYSFQSLIFYCWCLMQFSKWHFFLSLSLSLSFQFQLHRTQKLAQSVNN